jgi:transcriptional regulator
MAKSAPPLGIVDLKGCRCRCGHVWLPRIRNEDDTFGRPATCPSCKSPLWDRPKQFERTAKARR